MYKSAFASQIKGHSRVSISSGNMVEQHSRRVALLPPELWILIGEWLPVDDLKALARTDAYFRSTLRPLLRGCKLLQMITRQHEFFSIAFLVQRRSINIRVHDAQNMTVLHYAALRGLEEMTRALTGITQHKALLDVPENTEGNTPLIIAVRYRRKAILQLLLDAGAKVSTRNRFGETALFWAVKNHRADYVPTLVEHGADPDQPVRHGLTPLILAIMDRRLDMVQHLVQAGCDVQQPDTRGYRPLSWAVICDDLKIAQILLCHGTASPSLQSKGADRSPLVWAVMKGNLEMVRLLLSYSTEISQKQADRRSPLIWAVIHHDVPIAELLLQSGAPLEEADGSGQTALVWALLKGDQAMIELLLKYGAKPTSLDMNDR